MRAQTRTVKTHRNLGRFLVDSNPALWLVVETILAWGFFYLFAQFGKGAEFPEAQIQNQKGAFLFAMAFGLVGVGLGLFEKETRFNRLKSLQIISLTSIIAAVAGLFVLYFTSFLIVGRWSLALGTAGATISIYFIIHFLGALLLVYFPHKFLVVGKASPVGKKILELTSSSAGTQFKHANEIHDEIFKEGLSHTANMHELITRAREGGVSDLVVSWESKTSEVETEFLIEGLKQGLRIVDDVKYYTFMARRIPLESLPISYVLKLGLDIHRPLSGAAKRIFDLFFAVFLIVVLSPLFLLTSIAILLESGLPVFYKQKRFGRFGRKFNVYKFRSMKNDESGPEFTRVNDPRITHVGKFIRKAHIDEFPQLINILAGTMSFVGPRPESSEIVEQKGKALPLMHLRHIVRPGLTGHAQITQGKTEDSTEDLQTKLSYDLYYIKNFNFFFDLSILAKTASKLLKSTW